MTANMIGTVIIQILIGIILIIECYLYLGKKGEAGEVVKSVFVPLKYNAIKVLVYSAIFLVWFYVRVLLIPEDYTKMDLIYAAVLLAELIIAIVLDNLPQQICENGIITHRGYMAWSQIQSVEISEKPEIVQLKVKEKAGFMQQIFCVEADKRAIEEYVSEHMNYIPDVTETMESAENAEPVETAESAPAPMNVEEGPQETEEEIDTDEKNVGESETTEEMAVEVEKETVVVEEELEYDQISEWDDEVAMEESLDKKEE